MSDNMPTRHRVYALLESELIEFDVGGVVLEYLTDAVLDLFPQPSTSGYDR
jgi:hypothetical protein